MKKRTLSILLTALLVLIGSARAEVAPAPGTQLDPAAIRQELERVENIRLLLQYAVQDIHDAKALAGYLKNWGGPDRAGEAESLMREAEDNYSVARGVDHGCQAMQATIDAFGIQALSPAQLALVQRSRRLAAAAIADFYHRSAALKAELVEQVKTEAGKKIEYVIVSEPEPWGKPMLDADRRAGLQLGGYLDDRSFFNLPPDDMDYSLAKAAKAGFTYMDVSTKPAADWAEIEREPGKYDWSAINAIVERFSRHGIRINIWLSSLTGNPPAWHVEQQGDACRFVQTVTQGQTKQELHGINLFHAPTGEAYARFLTAYAQHLRLSFAQPVWVDAVYVEGQSELDAPVDESAAMDAFWKAWSRTDTAWRTPEAILAAENPDRAAAAAAEACRERWLAEYVTRVRAALKAGWPELRVQSRTVADDFHRLQARVTGRSRNISELVKLSDNPGLGSSACGPQTLVRSLSDGNWIWIYGIHAGCGATPAADISRVPFLGASRAICGRFVGVVQRLSYPGDWYRYQDRQFGDFGIGAYIMPMRRAREIAPVVLNTAVPAAEVAILWSQSTRRNDRTFELFESALAWGHILRRVAVNHDYIDEAGIRSKKLKSYKILILPNTQYLSQQVCDSIREWVRGGGKLLGFGAPGLFDEQANQRTSLPLADVFGADVARMRIPDRIVPDGLETTHSEGSFTFTNPRGYRNQTHLTIALQPNGGTARSWFVGAAKEVAIVEHAFGEGKALLCGYPLGHQYWNCARYELTYGLTHSRHSNYNLEQKQYEQWVTAELEKLGLVREVTIPKGWFLRAQRGDDPDWLHVYRNGPAYSQYMFEEENPVRTVEAFVRRRDGIDNLYVGLAHTEGNYFRQRGYFRCSLTGATVETSVAVTAPTPVVVDARLGVPVPASVKDGRATFSTWLPMSQSSVFAVSGNGLVRLFGDAELPGASAQDLLPLVEEYRSGELPAEVELLHPEKLAEFVEGLRGKRIVIGCGTAAFRPVGQVLADWLKQRYEIDARLTVEGPRASCRFDYMDSFGWTWYGPDPVHAAILIGNCQDNGLMFKFLSISNVCWLPVEINQYFPGIGRSFVMLSLPVTSDSSGRIRSKDAQQQLVIGATFPSEAMRAVKELQAELK